MNVDIINKQYIFNVNIDGNGNQTVNADIVSKQLIVSVDVFKGKKGDKGDKGEDGINGVDGTDGQDGKDLTLEDFNVVPETTTLVDADEFLVKKDGVWKSITKENLKKELNKEEILLSVRKIGLGSDNKALKLKRTSDNTLADIYFDENGEISANSQTSAGITFGNWVIGNLGAGSLQVFIWYNQSSFGSLYDAILYRGSTYVTYNYAANELVFYYSSLYFYSNFHVRNKFSRFDLYNVKRSGYTGGDNFSNLEQWAYGNHRCYVISSTNKHQIYHAGLGNQYISNINNDQMLLHTDKIYVGGSNDDDTQNTFFYLNGIELITVNRNRDHNNGVVLYGIQGGLATVCDVRRKEYRMYNYHPDIQDINSNIVSYYNL